MIGTQNFGRELVFSADLWYNGVYRGAEACSRRNEGFMPNKMGFAPGLCNTKAKLVIKQNDK